MIEFRETFNKQQCKIELSGVQTALVHAIQRCGNSLRAPHAFFDVVVFALLDVLVFVFTALVVADPETTVPAALHGKSNCAVLAIFVQKYCELPLEPTSRVPLAVTS